MLFAALRFGDHPSAKVLKIKTDEAGQLPGVIRVFTSEDIPGDKYTGLIFNDWPLMIGENEMTHYIGDVIAGVVADSEETARKAVELIKVEYKRKSNSLKQVDEAFDDDIRIESKLGKRITKHLNKVTVNYNLYKESFARGYLDINPDDFKIDLNSFPEDMNFKAEIHYPNSITIHNFKIKTLLKKISQLKCYAFYDKDRFILTTEETFVQTKRRNLRYHSKLNLFKLSNGRYDISRSKVNRRVSHVGVFLPSKALRFIEIDGSQVVGIDAKTSQFLLLANLFKSFLETDDQVAEKFTGTRKTFIKDLYSIFKEVNNNSDDGVASFYTDVIDNDFYEVIRQELNLTTRKQAKIFSFSILFSKPRSKFEYNKKIKNKYPSIIETLDRYKEKGGTTDSYKALSINLQALEAEIFIDHIFNELNRQKIYCFTRHDSVIVGINNKDLAYEIIENKFRQFGFIPKLETEYYTEEPNSKNIDDVVYEDNSFNIIWDDAYDFILNINSVDDIYDLNVEQTEILIELGWLIDYKIDDIQELESEYNDAQKNQWELSEDAIQILYNMAITMKELFLEQFL
jgi:hypothetical protein